MYCADIRINTQKRKLVLLIINKIEVETKAVVLAQGRAETYGNSGRVKCEVC